MKAIGYIRVSTLDQAREGVSLQAQRERVEAWAVANDFELAAVFEDSGISGKRASNRAGLNAAVAEACRQKAALVVYSLSRLSRSVKDTLALAEQLDRSGANLVSLTERLDTTTAAGKMLFRMLAVLCEFERDLVSERTLSSMSVLKAQGRRISGQVPFGFELAQDHRFLVENPEEQKAIRLMHKLRKEEYSLLGICDILQSEGIGTKTGTCWSPKVVRDILKRGAA